MGNRKESLGITKLVRKKAEKFDQQNVSNISLVYLFSIKSMDSRESGIRCPPTVNSSGLT